MACCLGVDGAARLKPLNLWPNRREEAWAESAALNLGKFLNILDLLAICLEGIPRMERFMAGKLVSTSLSLASNVLLRIRMCPEVRSSGVACATTA